MNWALFSSGEEGEGGGGCYIDAPPWLTLLTCRSRASQSASISMAIRAGSSPQEPKALWSWSSLPGYTDYRYFEGWCVFGDHLPHSWAEVSDKKRLICFFGVWVSRPVCAQACSLSTSQSPGCLRGPTSEDGEATLCLVSSRVSEPETLD